MDIFKFLNPTAPTLMEQGQILNKLKSKMWVERYQAPGEFTLVGYARDGWRDILPLDTYISHVDTDEIMVVEDHQISSTRGQDDEIKITGRSLTSILDRRIGGATVRGWPFVDGTVDFWQPSEEPHWQIVNFMNGAIDAGHVTDPLDAIPYITLWSNIPDAGVDDARYIKWGVDVLTTVQEMLKAGNMGLKTVRPGAYSRATGAIPDANSTFLVYTGADRRTTAVLSYDLGEIEGAEYLWSKRSSKTQAITTGKWVGVRVGTGETYEERRQVFVDTSSIDNVYSAAPTGAALTQIQNGMSRRGLDVVKKKPEMNMVSVSVSKEGTHLTYRKDYQLGDIITVDGQYNVAAPFRVTEYVEIEDENGASGYPTLSAL